LIGDYLGMTIDMKVGQLRAPTTKFKSIAVLVKGLMCRAAYHKRWISVEALVSLADKA
jgi:hypothetical protein